MAATFLDVVQGTEALTPRRPPLRASVRRTRLLAPLSAPDAPPFAVLVAPAGYGKTTLLCDWSTRDPRPFAWVALDRSHDDPEVLLKAVARAVDDASASDPDARVVLVLDDVQVLQSAAARETVAGLGMHPPAELTVVLASRSETPLPVARLRAQGLVIELNATDLTMTRTEAAALLKAAGLPYDRDDLDVLVRRTEGWPVGLALAALSLADQQVPGPAVARFGGSDRIVAEYLRDEVLADLSDDVRRFVMRTSVLDVLTAALCDEMLERSDSAAVLGRLQRTNFPLVALDRTGERYRHHHLLTDMMGAELHRSEPELEAELHRRASAWHARAGDRERALRHALAADEVDRATDLVWTGLTSSIEHGSSVPVEHWLSRFTDAQVAARPRLALAAAGMQLAHGRGDLAEHWVRAAASAAPACDDAAAGGVAALRAALGRDGLAAMGADAARAAALLAPDSPCQSLCRLIGGVAEHLRGDRRSARRRLEEGARRAVVAAPQIHALCLSQLALAALEDHDAEGAAQLIARARAQVVRHRLGRYPTSALVLAVSALVRAQRGRVEDAAGDAREASELLGRLTDVAPWYEIEVQIVLARTALRLSDANEARARIAAARCRGARLPEAVVLHEWLRTAEADLADYTRSSSHPRASLTTAELRILQFLPTHLSFREIGERAFVSANTVKTQANAVYRKLDVRSRSEAVTCARELGLLDA
jgi:LuxR family maltose regulon positive regulatory protein